MGGNCWRRVVGRCFFSQGEEPKYRIRAFSISRCQMSQQKPLEKYQCSRGIRNVPFALLISDAAVAFLAVCHATLTGGCLLSAKTQTNIWILCGVYMMFGRSQKSFSKSNITGVRDQCEKPLQELCAFEEPCLKSERAWKKETKSLFQDVHWKQRLNAAPQRSFIVLLKKRKYWPHTTKTPHYCILSFVALHQCQLQSLANCTKTVTEKRDVI